MRHIEIRISKHHLGMLLRKGEEECAEDKTVTEDVETAGVEVEHEVTGERYLYSDTLSLVHC